MRGEVAPIKGAVLRWARESAGLDVESLALKLKIPAARVRDWEEDSTHPSIPQARKLAALLKRPFAALFLSTPPPVPDPLPDFRRRLGAIGARPSPALLLEIRKARQRREAALDLLDALGEDVPDFDLPLSREQDPELAADALRNYLRVTVERQRAAKSAYASLALWRDAAEECGVLVTQFYDVDTLEASAFSISDRPLPLVALNVKDSPNARSFSLLHELAHLGLRESGLCGIGQSVEDFSPNRGLEAFCNRVAGATLVPAESLRQQLESAGIRGSRGLDDDSITALARSFAVSREVLLLRMVALKLIPAAFYETKREQYEQDWQRKAAMEALRPKPPGFVLPHVKAISQAGPLLSRLVIQGYDSSRIGASDASALLEVRFKQLDKIRSSLVERGDFGQ